MNLTTGTVTFTNVHSKVEVDYSFYPGSHDVRNLPNGDPGYPGDPAEFEITQVRRFRFEYPKPLTLRNALKKMPPKVWKLRSTLTPDDLTDYVTDDVKGFAAHLANCLGTTLWDGHMAKTDSED